MSVRRMLRTSPSHILWPASCHKTRTPLWRSHVSFSQQSRQRIHNLIGIADHVPIETILELASD